MIMVIDTSAIVAVLTSEPQRAALIRVTDGVDLIAPGSVHWEIGNALSSLLKRRRATLADVQHCLSAYEAIPLRLVEVDLAMALDFAAEHGMYAYDAYLVICALSQRAPLLTLDKALARVAASAGVEVVEVSE